MSRRSKLPLVKLPVRSGREVCFILVSNGFVQIRQRGSHIVMQRADKHGTTTVVVPDHGEFKTGTMSSIIRQSGLKRQHFE